MNPTKKRILKTIKVGELVLGGGPAGLLYCLKNKDAVLLTDKFGGQFSHSFQLGPKYLHVDDNTTALFKRLSMNPEIKKIKIGFHYNGKVNAENTEKNRMDYFYKTRKNTGEPYKSSMSANMTQFDSFDVSLDDLVEALKRRVVKNSFIDKVVSIDVDSKVVMTEKAKFTYDKLVSTLPLNIFLYLCGLPDLAKRYLSYPTTFILAGEEDLPFKSFDGFDYVYVSDDRIPYHRITNTDLGPVFEFKGDNIPPMPTEKDRFVMKVGQLLHSNIDIRFKDVTFLGRYAEWKHGILVNHILEKVYGGTQ